MANIGIIAEFNPFHTGHKYLIDEIKGKDDTVVCVMSGEFVQRGDVALCGKAERVSAALKNGADLIIELPVPYALSTAECFAKSSIHILKSLGIINTVCFGSECGDINTLCEISEIINSNEFQVKVADNLKSGNAYPKIQTDILSKYSPHYADILKSPNNILGVEYIGAAKALGFSASFKTVSRFGAGHNSSEADVTAGATYIREKILSGNYCDVKKYIPYGLCGNFANIKNIESAVLASLRLNNSAERYSALPDISEGLENRIVKAVKNSVTLNELYENIKTKRYTSARIRRIILCAVLNITAQMQATLPPYIRVLGFTQKGEAALKQISAQTSLPIICTAANTKTLSTDAKKVFEAQVRAADLWALALNYPQKCGNEYLYKIVKE